MYYVFNYKHDDEDLIIDDSSHYEEEDAYNLIVLNNLQEVI